MNPQMLRVTNRIIERSRETRSAYLERIEQAKTNTVHRSQLACGNLAHGFAARQPHIPNLSASRIGTGREMFSALREKLSGAEQGATCITF